MTKQKSNWSLLTLTFIERFAYYLFMSVLILHLLSGNKYSDKKLLEIYGIFKMLIYYLPAVLGLVSDITDRKKIFKIGLGISIIGYALVPISSSYHWLLMFSLAVLAIGLSIVRPNIPVLIGDNISIAGNNKRLFHDFILMMFLMSLAPMIAYGINDIFTEDAFITVIYSSSILMLIAFLLYHFIPLNKCVNSVRHNLSPKQTVLFLTAIFITSIIVYVLKSNIRPSLAIEMEGSELTFQSMNNFFNIPFTLILLGVLVIKSIKIQIKNLIPLLGSIAIIFAILFLLTDFNLLSKFSFTAGNILMIVALIAALDTLLLPVITLLIYKFSFKYKAFVFGLHFSLIALASSFFNRLEMNNIILIILIGILFAMGIIILTKKKYSPNV